MSKKATVKSRNSRATRFPGESPKYRAAREKLLKSEIALRRQTEAVAAQRRKLPIGGALKEDYVFEELLTVPDRTTLRREVRLSSLFAKGKDTLVIYNYMFGPAMGAPCPMCSSILDGLNGNAQSIAQRVNLAVVVKSPIDRVADVARGRGWENLRLLSSAGNTFNRDYLGETDHGAQMPMLNVFVRRGGRIHHWWGSELLFTPADNGQDFRHVDPIWPLWNVFDLTPEGRGTKWYPKLRYH